MKFILFIYKELAERGESGREALVEIAKEAMLASRPVETH
jgi:hypothetical protein